MVSPASTRPLVSTSTGVAACLSSVSDVTVDVGVLVESGAEVATGPVGGVPEAVAVLATEPASTSTCVITYVFVQVTDALGASAPGGQTTGAVLGSAMEMSVSVTVPVFWTTKL